MEEDWWLSECEKLETAGEREKWKIIGRLTNCTSATQVQPIRKIDNSGVTVHTCLRMQIYVVNWRTIIYAELTLNSLQWKKVT